MTTAAIVDACVHPTFAGPADLAKYLPKPYSEQRFAAPLSGLYPPPIEPYISTAALPDGALPGSDAPLMDSHVLDAAGADYAILLPLARGLLGDPQLCVAIDAAINEWLAETWLSRHNTHERYRGSIRVSPRSPKDAVREIERWADHPFFVQVAVPLESRQSYGEQIFFEVWEAAAEHGLPVAIHSDHAGGLRGAPTALGYPTTYLEAYSHVGFTAVNHLASLIAHGVLDRLESLVFVFADGGFDYMQTLMWRLDKAWRSGRSEVPWMRQAPSQYLADQVRYVVQRSDGAGEPAEFARFAELNDLDQILMYGSNYPHWDHLPASEFAESLPDHLREPIMGGNAARLYRLPVGQAAGGPAR